jgi:DinB superfamily
VILRVLVEALLLSSGPAGRERPAPPLSDAFASFRNSQDEVRAFLSRHADLDLGAVRFPNPFVRGIRFSLATGLHVITAHERRHLWQVGRVRRAAEAQVRNFPELTIQK